MKTHFVLLNEQKTICGKNKYGTEFVSSYLNIEKVNCVVCIKSIVANAGGMVIRTGYNKIKKTT